VNLNEIKNELKNLISGTGKNESGNLIQTIAYHLRESKATSSAFETTKFTEQEEEKCLVDFITTYNLWYKQPEDLTFIAEGAEQKVYLLSNGKFVIKHNDSIFYAFWYDYLISLLLHNYFFPATSYELLGFLENQDKLFAVVKQVYVETTATTNLLEVGIFLNNNGFDLKKNNDYFNNDLGIILEDLHDENVLTNTDVLFFIDTVFYLTKDINK
jgi:hypothetical protein